MTSTLMGLLAQAASQAAAAVHQGVPPEPVITRKITVGIVGQVTYFMFSVIPQWVLASAAIGGALLGLTALVLGIRHRARVLAFLRAVPGWFGAQSRGYKIGVVSMAGAFVIGGVGVSGYMYHYSMHENDFCQSCHVMNSAWTKYQSTKHANIECHACHRQSIFASMKELYYWTFDRPNTTGGHAKVKSEWCAECHITNRTDSTWKRIVATAGHRVHLKSDTAALKDVQCVSCHGVEIHVFRPPAQTCGQAGCHDQVKVRMGKMADATAGTHCLTCHAFSAKTNEALALDTAKKQMAPGQTQCLGACHEMKDKTRLVNWDAEPHKADCSACHNPHKQETPGSAFLSCATGGCHSNADTLTAFHRGLPAHKLDDCAACHQAHTWKVEGRDCLACHKGIYAEKPRVVRLSQAAPSAGDGAPSAGHVATPFGRGSASAARPVAPPPARGRWSVGPIALRARLAPLVRRPAGGRGAGGAWAPAAAPAAAPADPPRAPRPHGASVPFGLRSRLAGDTAKFAHGAHKALKCTDCHDTADKHGAIGARARDCQGCHHGGQGAAARCDACHVPARIPVLQRQVTFEISARTTKAATTRTLGFRHDQHAKAACASCHDGSRNQAVTKDCTSCHADHHASPTATCSTCHVQARAGHDRAAHEGCAACHVKNSEALEPRRNLCLTCHVRQADHQPGGDCATCHQVGWTRALARGAP